MATNKKNLRMGVNPICKSMVACDGITVTNGKDICAKCRARIATKNAPSKPLRGAYLAETMDVKKSK